MLLFYFGLGLERWWVVAGIRRKCGLKVRRHFQQAADWGARLGLAFSSEVGDGIL